MQMSLFGAAWHLARFENAHLIKQPHVTDLVGLLMTATVHTGTIRVQWQSEVTRPHYVSYPDGNKTQNLYKKISVHIDLLHAVVPRAVLATASLV